MVENLICSSFPGSRIKSGMTKMVWFEMVSPGYSRSPIWSRTSSAGMTSGCWCLYYWILKCYSCPKRHILFKSLDWFLMLLINRIFLFYYNSSNTEFNESQMLGRHVSNNHRCNWSFLSCFFFYLHLIQLPKAPPTPCNLK